MRAGEAKEICPRCGRPVSWFEKQRKGSRVYLVAAHYEGLDPVTGRKRVKRCYLGPVGGYEYVSRMHQREGLVLRGLYDRERALLYLDALIDYLARAELDPRLARSLAIRFRRLADRLEEIAEASRVEGEE